MDKERAVEIGRAYIAFLRERGYPVTSAWLFGSYAKGNFTEDSDIDIALFMENVGNSFLLQVELMKLSRHFDTRLEPHPIPSEDAEWSTIGSEAMKYGFRVA
mgnify:CR=1 FL=1